MYLDCFVATANNRIHNYQEAVDYIIKERGLSKEDIDTYLLGYTKFASVRENNSEDYDKLKKETFGFKTLQKRLIIPLRNLLGHTNGLVVRSLEEKKYMQYFLKEAKDVGAFFGLYEALPHISRTRKVFIHEAAIDCISFSKAFPNSVSTLTSFINEAQFETLKMFADKIILVFDEDGPGQYGARKIKETYGEKHFETVSLGYNDSNACLKRMGKTDFIRFVRSKVPIFLRD